MYAAKLPIAVPFITDFSSSGILGTHITNDATNAASVVRRKLTRQEAKQFLKQVPASIRRHCYGISKSTIGCLPLHVHLDDASVINFYVATSGEETVFFSGAVSKLDVGADDIGNGYFLVSPDGLTRAMAFTAAPGDVWALNTRAPHAVYGGANKDRHVVQLYLDISLDEIVEKFNKRTQ
jgi:hypothetical protein